MHRRFRPLPGLRHWERPALRVPSQLLPGPRSPRLRVHCPKRWKRGRAPMTTGSNSKETAMGLMELIESGNAADVKECLSFRLGGEEYGIDILAVREIREYEKPTRIASAPAFILGVINLRGVIVPIVDLRIKFGVAEAIYEGSTVVIILNVANRV